MPQSQRSSRLMTSSKRQPANKSTWCLARKCGPVVSWNRSISSHEAEWDSAGRRWLQPARRRMEWGEGGGFGHTWSLSSRGWKKSLKRRRKQRDLHQRTDMIRWTLCSATMVHVHMFAFTPNAASLAGRHVAMTTDREKHMWCVIFPRLLSDTGWCRNTLRDVWKRPFPYKSCPLSQVFANNTCWNWIAAVDQENALLPRRRCINGRILAEVQINPPER